MLGLEVGRLDGCFAGIPFLDRIVVRLVGVMLAYGMGWRVCDGRGMVLVSQLDGCRFRLRFEI